MTDNDNTVTYQCTGAIMDAITIALTNERNGYSSFDDDYTPSPETIGRVYDVLDYMKAHPDKWNQNEYGNHLSEKNCFMGILCRLDGKKTSRFPWVEDNGDVAEDFHDYSEFTAMELLDMYDPHSDNYGYHDRATYIAHFTDVYVQFDPEVHENESYYPWRHPTFDEMVERVSIALNYDFRQPRPENNK